MQTLRLKHLVKRYIQDKAFLKAHPEKKELLEKRMRRHERDIAEYVSSSSFQLVIEYFNL